MNLSSDYELQFVVHCKIYVARLQSEREGLGYIVN